MVNIEFFSEYLKWKATFMNWYIRLGVLSSLATLILIIIIIQRINILNSYNKTRYVDNYKSASRSIEDRENRFYSNLPEEKQSEKIAANILEAADGLGLKFQHAEFSTLIDPKSHLLLYRIKLPLKGTYIQIRQFLIALLESQPSSAINQLEIIRNDALTDVVQANLAMTIYFRSGASR